MYRSAVFSVFLLASLQFVVAQIPYPSPGIFVRTHHLSTVTCIAADPRGQYVASGSVDETVKLWNPDTGLLTKELQGHTDTVTCLVAVDNGFELVSGSDDGTVRFWNSATGELIHTITMTPVQAIRSVRLHRQSGMIAVCSGRTIAFVDASQRSVVDTYEVAERVIDAGFTPDGGSLFVCLGDRIEIRDAVSRQLKKSLPVPDGGKVRTVACGPLGHIAAIAHGGALFIWNPETGDVLAAEVTSTVWGISFSPDGRQVVTGGDTSILILDTASGKIVKTLPKGYGLASAFAFGSDPEGMYVGISQRLHRWNVADGSIVWSQEYQRDERGSSQEVAFSPDGCWAAMKRSSELDIWTLRENRLHRTVKTDIKGVVTGMAFSPNNRHIAVATNRGIAYLVDLKDSTMRSMRGHTDDIRAVAFSPQGTSFASGSDDGTVRIWDIKSGETIRVLDTEEKVYALAFHSCGRFLASGGVDRIVRLWDVETGRQLNSLKGHRSLVSALVWSPRGRYIVSADFAGTIVIWDFSEKTNSPIASAHEGRITSLDMDPTGTTLVSGGKDNKVRLWDIASTSLLGALAGHSSDVLDACFSYDGRTLYSAGKDSVLCVWDITDGELVGKSFSFGRQGTVTFTPDGYFKAPEGLASLVAFGTDEGPVVDEAFRESRHRPDIVDRRLASETVEITGVAPQIGNPTAETALTIGGSGFQSGARIAFIGQQVDNRISGYQTQEYCQRVLMEEPYVYLADGGFHILDAHGVHEVGVLSGNSGVLDFRVEGDHAFLCSGKRGFQAIDISHRSQPRIVGSYSANRAYFTHIELIPPFAIVGDIMTGLLLIDIADPSDPRVVGEYGMPLSCHALAVLENLVYMCEGTGDLHVFDIADREKPVLVYTHRRDGTMHDISVDCGHAFVAHSEAGLMVFDIATPAFPVLVRVVPNFDYAHRLSLTGNRCYVGDNTGISVFDVSDPLHPVPTAFYPLPATKTSMSVRDSRIYVTNAEGLHVLQMNPEVQQINVIDSGNLEITIAAGMSPGIYDVKVINPDGTHGIMEDAYQVRGADY